MLCDGGCTGCVFRRCPSDGGCGCVCALRGAWCSCPRVVFEVHSEAASPVQLDVCFACVPATSLPARDSPALPSLEALSAVALDPVSVTALAGPQFAARLQRDVPVISSRGACADYESGVALSAVRSGACSGVVRVTPRGRAQHRPHARVLCCDVARRGRADVNERRSIGNLLEYISRVMRCGGFGGSSCCASVRVCATEA